MPTFGFSAFLKLISQNPKPQRRTIRERLLPASGEGYDFHRSLKLHARRYLVDSEPMEAILASAGKIKKDAEKKSAIRGLTTLNLWRDETPGEIFEVPARTFESPNGLFKVAYQPDFGVSLPTGRTPVHLWNTKTPTLDRRLTYAALSLFPDMYDDGIDDLSVLSLHEPRLIRLNEVGDQTVLAANLIAALENTFLEVMEELSGSGSADSSESTFPAPPTP